MRTCPSVLAYDIARRISFHRTYPRFQINQDGSGDVSRVVALVVKYILAVAALGRKVFEVSVLADAVFLTELLPELASDYGGKKS